MSDTFNPGGGWREITADEYMREAHTLRLDGNPDRYWVRVPPVPPLPTEPGYYLTTEPDYGGGPVVVELLNRPAGQWVDAGDRQYLNEQQVRDMLPLVRLEPRAVTAKAVLDRMREAATGPQLIAVCDDIAREFGVQS